MDFGHGSGLAGLKDRTEALGGRLTLHSAPGAGTAMEIALPLDGPGHLPDASWMPGSRPSG